MSKFNIYLPLIIILIISKFLFVNEYFINYSPVDDNLFIDIAGSYIYGDFSYNPYMLSKLHGFPLILFILNKISLSYILLLNILMAICFLIFLSIKTSLVSWEKIFIGFLFLFNPFTLMNDWVYILREPLFSLIMILILLNFYFIFYRSLNKNFLIISLLILLQIFFFIREEALLLYLSMIIIFLFINNKINLKNILIFIITPLLFFVLAWSIFSSINEKKYDVNLTHDILEGEFSNLLGNIAKIDTDEIYNTDTFITKKKLILLSEISPTFRLIEPAIPIINSTNSASCINHSNCDDYSIGYIIWWIKKAPFTTGVAIDHKSEQNIYKNISYEINRACSDNIINCGITNNLNLRNIPIKFADNFFKFIDKLFFHKYSSATRINMNLENFTYEKVLHKYPLSKFSIGPISLYADSLKLYFKFYEIMIAVLYFISLIGFTACIIKKIKISNFTFNFHIFIFSYLTFLSIISLVAGSFDSRMLMPLNLFISLFVYMTFKEFLQKKIL